MDFLPYPSAIFEGIETAALVSGDEMPYLSSEGKVLVVL